MAQKHHLEENPGEEGPVMEWDARYPGQNQTAADAPPGYINLFEDFFPQGNLWLPVTEFMAHILHISQMSPPRMVRVRHFEFLCRSHGIEPTVERCRAFYQLIRNMGFYSFASRGSAKKILMNPPKSFHDLKQNFFFIREEVIPIAMTFRSPDVIEKEELAIPKKDDWYVKLTATPNRVFGENILVTARMSDPWPAREQGSSEVRLYQAAFPTYGGSMGVRPLEAGEQYWYDEIKGHFMFPVAGAFADPHSATESAHIPNPMPLLALTSAGKNIVYLSSEESVEYSNRELSS
ncbi:hypothetical protein Hanom_Chr08g00720911 [Helianthus anomalus]